MNRLDRRIGLVWAGQAVLAAAFVAGVGTIVGWFVAAVPEWAGVAAGLVLAVVGGVLAALRYRYWRYEVRDDALYLERGVFTRVRTVVPYVRVQHVDASRGPLERLIGLATTVVYTAGSRGADVTVPGLTPDRADDLQDRLKRLAIRSEGDDAV